jgi:hypothetical protein
VKRRGIGFVYVTSGLLVIIVGIILTGMMLGMTTAIFSATSLLIPPFFVVGPSLLILTGITEIGGGTRQPRLWAIGGGTVVSLLAVWTIPRIGWRLAGWLILEPVSVALLIAGIVMLAVKKSWIDAVIGSALSVPFFLIGSGAIIYGYFARGDSFAWVNVWLFAPAVLPISCFILALHSRQSFGQKYGTLDS